MSAWRLAVAAGLVTLAGIPLLLPYAEVFRQGPPRADDGSPFLHFAGTTLALAGATVALAVPLGTLLAVLLFRTDLPGRHLILTGAVLALFIPLPLLVSAWQALLGSDGLFPLRFWGQSINRPVTAGLVPAVWVHVLAALPWVLLIVGSGLGAVESELEEEALLVARPSRVLFAVTLPRCRGSIAAAALWLAVYVAADIGVTAILQVPTYAEVLDTQLNMGGREALARTLRGGLPGVIITWILLLVLVPRLERMLPPLQLGFTRQPLLSLGKARWPWTAACSLGALVFVVVPCAALIWKLGLAGTPRAWAPDHAARQFLGEVRLYGVQVVETLAVALLTGGLTAGAALAACWAAQTSRSLKILLLGVVTLAWTLPAPVVGIGLAKTIITLVDWFPFEPVLSLFYYGPSPVPILWAHVIRFLPYAVAILWPAVRSIPPELRDAARLDGATRLQELVHVTIPMTRRALGLVLLTVTALSLGEVGAAARVETPNWETFAKLIFDRLHYGADANVAALALILLTAILVSFGLALLLWRLVRRKA